MTKQERERLRKLIQQAEEAPKTKQEEQPGINYSEEYRKQTGKDIETGEYVVQ